ncbi:MAG: hypothetical protein WCH40_05670 [Verrucomicrobiales bacterium]
MPEPAEMSLVTSRCMNVDMSIPPDLPCLKPDPHQIHALQRSTMRNRSGKGGIRLEIGIALAAVMSAIAESAPSGLERLASPGDTTYLVDPENGNDANLPGKPWKSYGKLNAMKLAPGDQVLIAPGRWNAPQKLSVFGEHSKVTNGLHGGPKLEAARRQDRRAARRNLRCQVDCEKFHWVDQKRSCH